MIGDVCTFQNQLRKGFIMGRGRPKGSKNKRTFSGMKDTTFKMMKCEIPNCTRETKVDGTTDSVVCWEHVQKMVGIDAKWLSQSTPKKKKKAGEFPQGWHLMKQYVHPDGRVFHKGKEQPNLKGTFPPTPSKQKDESSKLLTSQRRRIREEKQLKKQQRLAKRYIKKKKGL